jgi:hypothetical protein
MAHWKRLFPANVMEVKYEDVVADHRGMLERIVKFVGLPWTEVAYDQCHVAV